MSLLNNEKILFKLTEIMSAKANDNSSDNRGTVGQTDINNKIAKQ